MIDLREYQTDALDDIERAEREGVKRPLVVHPTGCGKTIVMGALAKRRADRGRSIVLVHREELADQFIEKLSWQAPELSTGIVRAGLDQVDADVVVASVPTIQRDARLQRVLAAAKDSPFETVICDEAHHSPSPSWTKVLTGLGAFHPYGPLTVGFTATPERGGGKTLGVWEKVVSYMSIREAIYGGYLVPILPAEVIETEADLSKVRRKAGGDFSDGDLGTELERSGDIDRMADAVLKLAANRKGVAFLPTVKTSKMLAEALCRRGIAAEHLDGEADGELRTGIKRRLKSGETRWVVNCAVLTEGFDETSISCILIGRATVFHGLFVQQIGRGTRIFPGKENLLVLDGVGATKRHELSGLVDIGPELDTKRKKREEGAERMPCPSCGSPECEAPELHRCTLCHRYLPAGVVSEGTRRHANCDAGKAGKVDVFGASRLRWLPVESGWCLGAGKEIVIMIPAGLDSWKLAAYERGRIKVLHDKLPGDWARGIGEDRAKAFQKLVERDARWLAKPVSQLQVTRLLAEGVPEKALPRLRNSGEAADLLTRIGGRRALRKLGC